MIVKLKVFRCKSLKIWKRLNAGTVLANKEYTAGTVPANKEYAADTVPANKEHAADKPTVAISLRLG